MTSCKPMACNADNCPAEPPGLFCQHHWKMIPFKLRQALRHFSQPVEEQVEPREEFAQAMNTAKMLVRRQENRDQEKTIPITVHNRAHGFAKTVQAPAIDVIIKNMKKI